MDDAPSELRDGYDSVAAEYAEHFRDELARKPFDRLMLDWLAEKVGGRGPVCDMGCGPGQVAGYLAGRGVEACGVDLSPGMVREARRLNPGVSFAVGDVLALDGVADESYGGVAAFYSIIHVPRGRVVEALGEVRRVLRPGGVLLVTFHLGRGALHREEFFGRAVSLDFHLFETAEMKEYLAAANLGVEEAVERDPYPEIEYPIRRAYVFARKP